MKTTGIFDYGFWNYTICIHLKLQSQIKSFNNFRHVWRLKLHKFKQSMEKAVYQGTYLKFLSWMVEMINEGQKEEIAQNELDRVAQSLLLALE